MVGGESEREKREPTTWKVKVEKTEERLESRGDERVKKVCSEEGKENGEGQRELRMGKEEKGGNEKVVEGSKKGNGRDQGGNRKGRELGG